MELFGLIACCFLIIILYDGQLQDIREQLNTLQTKVNADKKIEGQALAQQTPTATTPEAPSAQNTPANTTATTKSTITDLFGTDDADSNSAIDRLKNRYENTLVTYLFLTKCEKTTMEDYNLIMAELQKEMLGLNAPQRLQNDILTAAKGSYDEMYSKNSCEKEAVETTVKQYSKYISNLSAKH